MTSQEGGIDGWIEKKRQIYLKGELVGFMMSAAVSSNDAMVADKGDWWSSKRIWLRTRL